MTNRNWLRIASVPVLIVASIHMAIGEHEPLASAQRHALESLNSVIGQWRGTGQVRRGSNAGAWRQTSEFVWDFTQQSPAIRYIVTGGELTESAMITWSPDTHFQLELKEPDGDERTYRGNWEGGKLILESEPDAENVRYRLSITPLNEKRTLVLHEKTSAGGSSYFRIAEVGHTRAGTRLALPGGGQRECVVTGGTAQTAVTYKGETYYVCCTGCQQAFEDDPEGIITEFKQRMEQQRSQSQN